MAYRWHRHHLAPCVSSWRHFQHILHTRLGEKMVRHLWDILGLWRPIYTHFLFLGHSWSTHFRTQSYANLLLKKQPTVLTPVLNLQFSLFSKREYRCELPLGVRAAGISAEHQASHWDSATTVISKRPEDEKRTEMLKTRVRSQ